MSPKSSADGRGHRRQLDRRREHRGEHLVLGVDLLLGARHRPALAEERDLELLEELGRVARAILLVLGQRAQEEAVELVEPLDLGERARTMRGAGCLMTESRISRESLPSHGKSPAIIS